VIACRRAIVGAVILSFATPGCFRQRQPTRVAGITRLEDALDPTQIVQASAGHQAVLARIDNWMAAAPGIRRAVPLLKIDATLEAMTVTKPAGVPGRFSVPLTPFARTAWSYAAVSLAAPRSTDIVVSLAGQRYVTSLPGHATVVMFDASRLPPGGAPDDVDRIDFDLGPAADVQEISIRRVIVLSRAARYSSTVGVDSALKDEEQRQAVYLHGGSRVDLSPRQFQPGDRLKFAASALEAGTVELQVSLVPAAGGAPIRRWNIAPLSATTWSVFDLDVGSDVPVSARLTLDATGPPESIAFMGNARIISAGVKRPNVIVYLVDALRADRLGAYGYQKRTSPFLDKFAASAVRFENAYANGPNTRLSVASLMTSNYPAALFKTLGFDAWNASISTNYPRLAEMFRRSGYTTGGFILNSNAGAQGNLQQGYDVLSLVRRGYETYTEEQSLLPKTFDWLTEVRSEPFFLYVHTLSVHGPWNSPAEFDRFYHPAASETPVPVDLQYLDPPGTIHATRERRMSRYDAAVNYSDFVFGVFLSRLQEMGLYDAAVILVIADHGDQLGEDGRWSHFLGTKLSRSLLRVPMLLKLPGRPPAVVTHNVQLLDVLPTLCEVAKLNCSDVRAEGRSLIPLLMGDRAAAEEFDRRPVFAEENGLSAFVSRYHWLDAGEAYDVSADPTETRPIQLPATIADALKRDVDGYRRRTRERFEKWGTSNFDDRMSRWVGASGASIIDPALQRDLRALGYIR
jgi:arylsulfatase A-like enzyme